MKDRTLQWQAFKLGDVVRCSDPDAFLVELARKLRNREGVIARFQMFSGAPIVDFPAIGRRKALQWVPPSREYLTFVRRA